MSDDIEITLPGQRPRQVVRTAAPRTAADAAQAGVASDIGENAARALPARDGPSPEPLTRRRREQREIGSFALPDHRKKPGWDYQFIAISVLGQPTDGSIIREFRDSGKWTAERSEDWPELCDPGTPPDAPIEMLGQRLYGRPLSLTLEARDEDYQYANRQQRDKMMAAATGRSAVRGEGGLQNERGVVVRPGEISLEGVAGR